MLRKKATLSTLNEHIVDDWENIFSHDGAIEGKLDPWVPHDGLQKCHVALSVVVMVLFVLETLHIVLCRA